MVANVSCRSGSRRGSLGHREDDTVDELGLEGSVFVLITRILYLPILCFSLMMRAVPGVSMEHLIRYFYCTRGNI